jgi:predicted MFS family arabinose efflux permease
MLGQLPRSATGFVAFLALACALGFAATPVIYAQLVTGWFSKRRGLALSVMFGCSSLGVGSWSQIAAHLMHWGWRTAYTVMGITTGSIILVASVLLLRSAPRAASRAAAAATEGISLRDAVKTRTFWKIALVFMLLTGALSGGSVNLPIILRLNNVSPEAAASVMAVVGMSMFIGMTSVGLMLDRWFAPYVTAGCALLPVLAFALLLLNHSTTAFFVAAALLGAGLGSELNAGAYMVSRAFGIRAFGAIYGLITLAFGLSSAAGPALIGTALAKSVNLNMIFGAAVALLLPAIFVLLSIKPGQLAFGPALRGGRLQPRAVS